MPTGILADQGSLGGTNQQMYDQNNTYQIADIPSDQSIPSWTGTTLEEWNDYCGKYFPYGLPTQFGNFTNQTCYTEATQISPQPEVPQPQLYPQPEVSPQPEVYPQKPGRYAPQPTSQNIPDAADLQHKEAGLLKTQAEIAVQRANLEIQKAKQAAESAREEAQREREERERILKARTHDEMSNLGQGSASSPVHRKPIASQNWSTQSPPPAYPDGNQPQDAPYINVRFVEVNPSQNSVGNVPNQPQGQYRPTAQNQAPTQNNQLKGMPLGALTSAPGIVHCPACGTVSMTSIEYEAGISAHIWAIILCLITGIGCIPYLFPSFKDVQHKCGHCGALLATYRRSGGTRVHQFASI